MSQTLLVELSDEMYAAIERQAAEERISPAQVVASSLEQHFRQERVAPKRLQRSDAELQAARERFEQSIGAVDLGCPTTQQLHHDLDALAGTWSAEEAANFSQAVEDFEQIDRELWQ